MAKQKGAGGGTVTNRPAYSRVSFLFQAAALLTVPGGTEETETTTTAAAETTTTTAATTAGPPLHGMARRLLTQMRSVARKTNMRVRPAVKQRVCKYCDTLLVDGVTSVATVENPSRGADRGAGKPWADVLAVACTTCGRARRYPVAAPRPPRRPLRPAREEAAAEGQPPEPRGETHKQAQRGRRTTAHRRRRPRAAAAAAPAGSTAPG